MSIQAKAPPDRTFGVRASLTALAAAAAAGLLYYFAVRPRPPEGSPTEAAIEHLRREMSPLQDGVDYSLASMETIRQVPDHVVLKATVTSSSEARDVFLRIDPGKRWHVVLDYEKSFRAEIFDVEKVRNDMRQRFADSVATRFHKTANLHPSEDYPTGGGDASNPEGDIIDAYFSNWFAGFDFMSVEGGLEPQPFIEFTFRYFPPGSLPGGRYRTSYRYEGGHWLAQGDQMFDKMPAPRLPRH